MKKKYCSWFVASMLMLAASSCSQEEVVGSSSQEMTTFKVSLEGQSQSRAVGEGSLVSKLYYEVYQNGRKVLDNNGEDANAQPVAVVNGAATVEMPILRGEKYDIMFWAEAENSIYDATDLKAIQVDYSKTVANQDAYDAFFYGEQGFQASAEVTTIELRRPFGQLNVGTAVADWDKAKTMIATGDPVTVSQLKLTGLANRFNVLTHVASAEGEVGEVTFSKHALTGETFSVKTSDNGTADYQNLSMNYLLVPTNGENSHKANVNITSVSFWRVGGGEELFSLQVPNVPVQRNWRTNILGDLLAADKTFEIVIVPIFDDTIDYPLIEIPDISLRSDYAEVYTAKGLLKWAYIVNKQADKKNYGLKLMGDIEMPALTIEEDATKGTYAFTETPITVNEEGVPSGSNWIPVCNEVSDYVDGYNGCIDGNNATISNLYIKREGNYTGLIGFMYDNGVIKNLTIENSVIYGGNSTGVVGGRSQHGSRIENVHVKRSVIMGNEHVGGIVGYNYRRDKVGLDEDLAYVKDCSTDKDTKVVGTGVNVGGICGTNYGAIILNCVNNADVTGNSNVGGIVGYCRDYYSSKDASIVADGYVLACQSTAEAVVKATAANGSAGGIVGHSLGDTSNHPYTMCYVVACHSASDVQAKTKGAIVGNVAQRTTIVASWADKKASNIAGKGSPDIIESALYENAADITEDIVEKMNLAIRTFNRENAEGIVCNHEWKWVSGSWPELTAR